MAKEGAASRRKLEVVSHRENDVCFGQFATEVQAMVQSHKAIDERTKSHSKNHAPLPFLHWWKH